MAKVIVFGVLDTAELAHYYLTHDSEHEVIAFTVNRQYIEHDNFHGLPVVAFEDVETIFPPSEYKFFAPMTGRNMNRNREAIYNHAKAKGYQFISYISSRATLFNNEIGENCFILEDNTIQPFTTIGNNVVLWSGNHIGHHGQIKDHVFFTSHVVLSGHCVVESYSFFGVNSTIRDYTTIAQGTLVGMASAIMKETEEWGVYVGNPAKKVPGKMSYEAY
ncbi:sugar O-acyltransferase (sialic acid O-acetyltransferase NeuD family) [Dyadobacter sp. BE34]|uniref:Sugar O-acyltransferase (Sialic acid O-acetyltransferase NeuD family) n=1 Tax=Dyadobacter fermentans TaxID=94254 RepID=A0ABU1R0W5_9BACT|nr:MULTISPECIES: acetyltransferase [Dyadobacter]MDR6807048.1 sugar O-acyltransferase (sialic acid O-acetyltransferase NeuD family) [Dyadobacter fermentans]MDR7044789.1 sugar O-acyltransferase (sialic acid O-acetyltransferase NeuD family) [Dyadobacter sp. BE242]MDR7199475.1 sugar O-acyltransferase (sialic acid O-acetyltransferase NeuD family) [Dyadobacter sp. BE34]MDR7217435.1 sugar O-acyltransferase (sialic acid O-acetyltransferase NeuD family) [Dyadobacter sp. BE31]MDR7265367.1 sugar O-acyltr